MNSEKGPHRGLKGFDMRNDAFSNINSNFQFDFQNPGRIIFGVNVIKDKFYQLIEELEATNVLLISDKIIKGKGLLNEICNKLEKAGIIYREYLFPISGEPLLESIRTAVDYARADHFDLFIGVGGGSILDLTKIMAIMSSNKGDLGDYRVTVKNIGTEKIKNYGSNTILIPTTAGTGAEVTNTATFIENKVKYWVCSNKLFPKVSCIDPLLTSTMPKNVTRDTGLEALGNLIEGCISNYANPLSDGMIQQGVHLIYLNLPIAYRDGHDFSARTAMSFAAMMGGWVVDFPWSSVPSVGHCISEIIGPRYNLPHGLCTGLMLPHAIDFNVPYINNKIRLILESFEVDTHRMDSSQVAKESVKMILDLMENMGLSIALKDIAEGTKLELLDLRKFVLEERQYLYGLPKFSPRKLNKKNVDILLADLWEGRFHNTGL